MEAIYGWVIAAVVALAGIVGAFVKGRNDGKKLEKAKQVESDLKASEKRIETVKQTKDISDSISKLPDDDVQQRLRDKYTRD